MKKTHGFINLGVSKNIGTPKSSIFIGFSIINHPFGVHLFLETPIRMTDDWLFLLIIDNMLIQVIKMAWYIWLMELILWVQVISWFLGNNTTNYTLRMVHKCSCSWFIIIQNLGPSSVNGVNDSSLSIPFIPYMSCWWNISEHGGDLPRFKECPTSGGLDTGPLSGRAASLLRHNGCKVHREGISSHQFVLYALCTCK